MITQCTSFQGSTGGCDTSLFQLSDITWANMTGTIDGTTLASLQCSGDAPCPGIDIELEEVVVNGTQRVFKCSNVVDPIGFTCNASA
jgi:galacturan 1,4-alpha-galacturonidase